MNDADEDAELHAKWVGYKSDDPLWLDLARAGERLWIAGKATEFFDLFDAWMLAIPPRHQLAIADGWADSGVVTREFIAAACSAMAEVPVHKRTDRSIVRAAVVGRDRYMARRFAEDHRMRDKLAKERKVDRAIDRILERVNDNPLRSAGRFLWRESSRGEGDGPDINGLLREPPKG